MSDIRASIAVFTGLASLLMGGALYLSCKPDPPTTAIYKVVPDNTMLAQEPNGSEDHTRTMLR